MRPTRPTVTPQGPAPGLPPSSARRTRLAAFAVAGLLAAFFAPALLGAGEFVHRDTGRMHAPMKRWIGEELAHGRFPAWNPYAGLGAPVIGNAIDAVQHPFTALFVVLPPGAALTAWVLLSFALAAAGAFAWARALGLSEAASAAAALAFALSGPLVSSSDNVTYLTAYAALPALSAAALRYGARGGPGPLALVAAASALCAAAGDPQAWGIAVGLLPVQAVVFAEPGRRRAALLRGLASGAAAAVAALPFLLPLAAWYPETDRAAGLSAVDLRRWNLHPLRLAELVLPDLFRGDPAEPLAPAFQAYAGNDVTQLPWFLSVYLGSAVVALAALGAARDRRARLLVALAALFTWAALGPHAGFQQLAHGLPILGSFRYSEKLSAWVALLVALAAAVGLDALLRDRPRRLALAAGIAAAALLAPAVAAALLPGAIGALVGGPPEASAALAGNLASGGARAGLVLALLALLSASLARPAVARAAPAALVLLVTLDLFGGNAGAYVLGRTPAAPPPLAAGLAPGTRVLSPFRPRDDRWPALGRLDGSLEWSRRTLGPSWNVPLRIGSQMEYVGLRHGRFYRYRAALGEGERMARIGLFGFGLLAVTDDPAAAATVGLAGSPRTIAEDPELPAWLVAMPHRPRAYVAGALREADAEGALAFAATGGPEGETALEGPIPAGYLPPHAAEPRFVRDDATDVEIAVEAPAGGGRALLVLSDLFAPGWSATVDGAPAAILRANGLVRAVWVEPGSHRVRFRYRTPGLLAGWLLALAGLGALGAWAVAERLKARRRQP